MPSRVTLKLNVIRFRDRQLAPKVRGNLERAMEHLRDEVKQVISRPFPPASRGGEPPRRRTGEYRDSIQAAVGPSLSGKSIVGRVGSDSPYARRLELGFVGVDRLGRNYNQAPRPHLRVTLERESNRVGRIIAGGA